MTRTKNSRSAWLPERGSTGIARIVSTFQDITKHLSRDLQRVIQTYFHGRSLVKLKVPVGQ